MATINSDHPQKGMIHAFESLFGRDSIRHYDYFQRQRDGLAVKDINAEFLKEAVSWNPDWMWLQLQNTEMISSETIDAVKKDLPRCLVSHWCGDVRPSVGPYFASICRSTHLTLVANVGYIPVYSQTGARDIVYMPHGLDWSEDVLGIPDWQPPFQVPEIVYCGNHYGENMVGSDVREHAVRVLHEAGLPVGVVGRGWDKTGLSVAGRCEVKQQVHVYRKAKVVLSVNHFPSLSGYHGDRTITAMASGRPVLQRWFPRIELEFEDGRDILVFRSDEELLERAKMLLDNEGYRLELGGRGRAAAIRKHSWITRILDILPLIEKMQQAL